MRVLDCYQKYMNNRESLKEVLLSGVTIRMFVGHMVMFYEPMEMFERIPFNNSLKGKSWVHLKASEGETSAYYMFFEENARWWFDKVAGYLPFC